MSTAQKLIRQCIAWRAAQDLQDGSYVNLGVGIPTEVARHVPSEVEVVFQSENGILGVGPQAEQHTINLNLVNASQQFVTVLPGASFFDCCESFAMLRGGHINVALLGAYEVAENGDLANWDRGDPDVPPAVGGAMDIAVGAQAIWILMEHLGANGRRRLVRETGLPLTGCGIVKRVYTDLAVIDITPKGSIVRELKAGLCFSQLQEITEWALVLDKDCQVLRMPNFADVAGED